MFTDSYRNKYVINYLTLKKWICPEHNTKHDIYKFLSEIHQKKD
ncbi:hypothetical protein QW3_0534 [Clostridioides difficile P74]|nr:hypothetical protein HMPREF1122_01331 [Clostridioides difficile 002-P50-2011]EHJ33656.1 hypothetical protein HMPREF1123_00366 [Clostridioides difficile 050-P50-2011]EQF62807.1 hypothetical protein QG7_0604 [Clostridioides difficile CD175]EQG23406.1 hypothetical protein QIG_0601 [Clostridioides difficile DA00065]EQK25534.1 hypothetical protein QUY_0597 [Clostridioides difficile P71]EQK35129.1 hypothetical protein QW3_0534 [Clostridioides difficile P74]CCL04533.1 hypothetical protein BN167_4